ncbi:hypothetical protein LZ318_15745 [Saccharopolyspora indica]|uniref:hypothetical protein n=1 Tax=Saccharopolyspora indica TaxID=1229659 RepID=UPI0022EB522A|nr:hypothetical protein [Saccharopolyspora indica]MDA3645960.1 hypothetical protein [Saccharopolyspora indica]
MDWLTPTLTLVGTLAVASAGVYQFRKTVRRKADSQYASLKAQALTELLDKLHSLELQSRERKITLDQLDEELVQLNKKSITEYRFSLDAQEQQWARDYIEGLTAVHGELQSTATETYEWWETTMAHSIPPEILEGFTKLQKADNNLKKRLKQAMRSAAG